MKQTLTALLAILLLPLALPVSIIIAALLLAMLAITSPALVLGGTLQASGKLANLITDWLSPNKDKTVNSGNGPAIASLLMSAILFPLLIVPVAVGEAVTAAFSSVLFIPALAVYGAYKVADKAIKNLYAAFDSNQAEVQVKHSYSKLPQGLGENQDGNRVGIEPQDILYFDPPLSQKKLNQSREPIVSSQKTSDFGRVSTFFGV